MGEFRLAPVVDGEALWGCSVPLRTSRVTARQEAILRCIADYQRVHRQTPSLMVIADDVGLRDPGSVTYQIEQLVAKGLLRRNAGKQRAIELVPLE